MKISLYRLDSSVSKLEQKGDKMLSVEYIVSERQKEAKRASRQHRVPYIVEREDIASMPPFPFPKLGIYVPKGWKLTDTYFVDSSGWGEEGESALTAKQLLSKLKVGYGYALREVGEFQVVVGEYLKDGTDEQNRTQRS
jgi:hypothetical protein